MGATLAGQSRRLGSVALGLSISLDELALGFASGPLRLPVVPVIALTAVQSFIVVQVGMRVGEGIGKRVCEGAERLAGVAALLAIGLLVAKQCGLAVNRCDRRCAAPRLSWWPKVSRLRELRSREAIRTS